MTGYWYPVNWLAPPGRANSKAAEQSNGSIKYLAVSISDAVFEDLVLTTFKSCEFAHKGTRNICINLAVKEDWSFR